MLARLTPVLTRRVASAFPSEWGIRTTMRSGIASEGLHQREPPTPYHPLAFRDSPDWPLAREHAAHLRVQSPGESMLKRHQIKVARELLGWSLEDCARNAGVGIDTLKRIELGIGHPRRQTMVAVLSTLEKAGIHSVEHGKLVLEPPTGGIFFATGVLS
jgi:DNA-binding XRE family transcriptional regulator